MEHATTNATLRLEAERAASRFEPLKAQALKLAGSLSHGLHGRRRAGAGDEFWQFRHAVAGDSGRQIDWRRSARSDDHFVREREWQSAQSVYLWSDKSLSMAFSGSKDRATKRAHSDVLALALSILLFRKGEKVGLLSDHEPLRGGMASVDQLTVRLIAEGVSSDHSAPVAREFATGCHVALFSDFLGPLEPIEVNLAQAANARAMGVMVQVLDPVEASFPYDGRTIFESVSGLAEFETRRARGLRKAYQDRLKLRQAKLAELAQSYGWQFQTHYTDASAHSVLGWVYQAIEGQG